MIKQYTIGSDDDTLTEDIINNLPILDTLPTELEEFTDTENWGLAYELGYKTYAKLTNGEFDEIIILEKQS